MPNFSFTIRDKNGKLVKGEQPAQTRQDLVLSLQKEGSVVISVTEVSLSEIKDERKLHKKVTSRDVGMFGRVVGVLIDNSVPLTEALEILTKQLDSTDLVKTVEAVKKDVEGGLSFHEALGKHQKVFGSFWVDMVEAGELSGQLPLVMREVVIFLEARAELRKKVTGALAYPVMLIFVVFVTTAIFLLKIVPIFDNIFKQFGSSLPPLTQAIVSMSKFLQKYFLGIVLAIGGIVFFTLRALKTKEGKRNFEKVLYSIPMLGNIMLAVSVEKFTSTLAVLLKSGIPIIKAIDVSIKTAESVLFIERVSVATQKVIAGAPLAQSLEQTGLFPALTIQLINVGEKTGNLSGMLEETAKYYKDVVDVAVTRFTTILGPLALIFMTVGIGFIVMGMFLPIFKLATLGGG